MNNPNPFLPQGSLMEQQNKRRKQMRIGVLCVLTCSVAGLMVMLIQGCKEKNAETTDNGMPAPDTNTAAQMPPETAATTPATQPVDTNPAPMTAPTNVTTAPAIATQPPSPISNPPLATYTPPPATPVTPPTLPPAGGDTSGGSYTVVKGDSPAKIAKKNGVSLKALVAANPDMKPTKLKIGQKLVIPAGGKATVEGSPAPGADSAAASTETYTVKSGDTLTKIAKAHHIKVKDLMAANHLTTAQIKVGKVLKLPAGAETAPAPTTATAPVPDNTTATAPPLPAINTVPLTPPASNPAPR